MGFGLKGDSLSPTTRFPIVIWFCNISHATVPPAPTFPCLTSFFGLAIFPQTGLGSRLAKHKIARLHFGKILTTLAQFTCNRVVISKGFAFLNKKRSTKSLPLNHCEVTNCAPTWGGCKSGLGCPEVDEISALLFRDVWRLLEVNSS